MQIDRGSRAEHSAWPPVKGASLDILGFRLWMVRVQFRTLAIHEDPGSLTVIDHGSWPEDV